MCCTSGSSVTGLRAIHCPLVCLNLHTSPGSRKCYLLSSCSGLPQANQIQFLSLRGKRRGGPYWHPLLSYAQVVRGTTTASSGPPSSSDTVMVASQRHFSPSLPSCITLTAAMSQSYAALSALTASYNCWCAASCLATSCW